MSNTRCVTIVGVGLIGGSIGLALREREPKMRIVGYGSRPATLEAAFQQGAITETATSAAQAVADADLVIVCAPVQHIVPQIRQLAPYCRPGTLLTDAGSTKQQIVADLEHDTWPNGVEFVGSHPLAGNEKSGAQHGRADLFHGRAVVITPTSKTSPAALERLCQFWSELGARVVTMPADEHDRALAVTSHLPHLIAAALAGTTPSEFVSLTAGGWQDTTRIAAGDPGLWQQIMLANRENLLAALQKLTDALSAWRTALEQKDAAALERLLEEAKRIRDSLNHSS